MSVGLPELDANFHPLVWCPMMIKLKENSQFMWTGAPPTGEDGNLIAALNSENFRGSLKEAYAGKSMSRPLHSNLRKLHSADSALMQRERGHLNHGGDIDDNNDEDD